MVSSDFLRQTGALIKKNVLIFRKHWIVNIFRCLIFPVGYFIFLGFTYGFFSSNAKLGIGNQAAVKDLPEAISRYSGKFLLIDESNNPSFAETIGDIITLDFPSNIEVIRRPDSSAIYRDCLQKDEPCIAAVKFRNLDLQRNIYNYTIFGSRSMAIITDTYRAGGVDDHSGPIPLGLALQHAVDSAVTEAVTGKKLPTVEEFSFSLEPDKARKDRNRRAYMSPFQKVIIIAYFVGILGPVYHLVSSVSQEHQAGLTYLMDVMGCRRSARFASWWLFIIFAYLPSFLAAGIIYAKMVFTITPASIVVGLHVLTLLVLVSYSLFLSSFLKRGVTSGIFAVIAVACLGFLAKYLESFFHPPSFGWAIMILLIPPSGYIYGLLSIASFEEQGISPTMNSLPYREDWTYIYSLVRSYVEARPMTLTVLFVLMALLICIYPFLGMVIEHRLHSTSPLFRRTKPVDTSAPAVLIQNLTKTYSSLSWFSRVKVTAVKNISLSVPLGSIVCLLGSNGSGKSTTLNCLTGLITAPQGTLTVLGRKRWELPAGTLSLCPQKNILWDELTPREHADIWRRIKSPIHEDVSALLNECDLALKQHSQSKDLSGGMKRRLQLLISLVGGSKVCCLDEVTSGLDPLSRRKILNILVANRGKRTFILTTHYIEEADLLGDWIAILSNGVIKCFGEPLELRNTLGNGYTIQDKDVAYSAKDSVVIAELVNGLPEDLSIEGPTLEQVFLKLAKEELSESVDANDNEKVNLSNGRRLGSFSQALTQLRKRFLITRRSYFAIPILTVILVGAAIWFTSRWMGISPSYCSEVSQYVSPLMEDSYNFPRISSYNPVCVGPDQILLSTNVNSSSLMVVPTIEKMRSSFLHMQNNAAKTQDVPRYFSGGLYFTRTKTTIAWPWREDLRNVCAILNTANNARFNELTGSSGIRLHSGIGLLPAETMSFVSSGTNFNWLASLGFMVLASAVWVSFPVLYPSYEKIRNVKSLQYSNQMGPLAVWTGHLLYEIPLCAVLSALIGILLFCRMKAGDIWFFGLVTFCFILLFFSLAAILLGYILSLKAKSQFSAFALNVIVLLSFFVVYLGGCIGISMSSDFIKAKYNLGVFYYSLAWLHPIIPLMHAYYVGVNAFELRCLDQTNRPLNAAGDWRLFGSSFFYLIIQSIVYFIFLIWNDSSSFSLSRRKQEGVDDEKLLSKEDPDVAAEEVRVLNNSDDVLQISQLSKSFGRLKAVDDVTFGVQDGECMALCGPNSAGKTTIFHLIRGVLRADYGDVFIQGKSITTHRGQARWHLGVCPQFDSQDNLTVRQQLEFYADIKGIPKRAHDVETVMRAVGLLRFSRTSCANLSGGNARKLSLAIALLGNPSILLLDEPSCGLDPMAKRIIWNLFPSILAGRAALITTHDMTEAVKLSNRISIVAKRLLAISDMDGLRSRFGRGTQLEVMTSLTRATYGFLVTRYPDAVIFDESSNRNLKIQIPSVQNASQFVTLIKALEEQRTTLDIKHYSLKPIDLEQIFLKILQNWKVAEEGEEETETHWYQLWRYTVYLPC